MNALGNARHNDSLLLSGACILSTLVVLLGTRSFYKTGKEEELRVAGELRLTQESSMASSQTSSRDSA